MWLEKLSKEVSCQNPIKGEDGKEDFLDEDILDVKLWTWKMYFNEAINQ